MMYVCMYVCSDVSAFPRFENLTMTSNPSHTLDREKPLNE